MIQLVTRNAFKVTPPIKAMVSRDQWLGHLLFTGAVVRMNHSCEPNCGYFYRRKVCGGPLNIVVYVLRDIQDGEELTISYISGGNFFDAEVRHRRDEIKRLFGFTCQCQRCMRESRDDAGVRTESPPRRGLPAGAICPSPGRDDAPRGIRGVAVHHGPKTGPPVSSLRPGVSHAGVQG